MPWDLQRSKMGKKGVENVPLSLSFCLTVRGNEPSAPALNAVPPTSHRWAPTRPAEGEPNTAFAGLRAVTGESSRWYASAALS